MRRKQLLIPLPRIILKNCPLMLFAARWRFKCSPAGNADCRSPELRAQSRQRRSFYLKGNSPPEETGTTGCGLVYTTTKKGFAGDVGLCIERFVPQGQCTGRNIDYEALASLAPAFETISSVMSVQRLETGSLSPRGRPRCRIVLSRYFYI